ncbi:tetratricopeptide repeat protein [Slackia heliotrinireducens]|uniref:tetratricopeptide repeat protein n=1 Tax=Slackia heliotrinireducens TaxID=84110 RepID=UPI003314A44D
MNPADYPYKLPFLTRFEYVDGAPLAPDGGQWGTLYGGNCPLPQNGYRYIAIRNPQNQKQVRIVGYADMNGRAFDCDEPTTMPPAKEARITLTHYTDKPGMGAVIALLPDNKKTILAHFVITGSSKAMFNFENGLYGSNAPRPMTYTEAVVASFVKLKTEPISVAQEASSTPPAAHRGPFDPDLFDRMIMKGGLFEGVRGYVESLRQKAVGPEALTGFEAWALQVLTEEGVADASEIDFIGTTKDGKPAMLEGGIIRTSRHADLFYLDYVFKTEDGEVTENGTWLADPSLRHYREQMWGIEGALNRILILKDYSATEEFKTAYGSLESLTVGQCSQMDKWLIDRIALNAADPTKPHLKLSRWAGRLSFAELSENVRMPYRAYYDFRTTKDGSSIVVNAQSPSIGSLPKSRWDEADGQFVKTSFEEQVAAEARYAAHLAIVHGCNAFASSPTFDIAVVNIFRCGTDDVVTSVVFDRSTFTEAYAEQAKGGFANPFGFLKLFGHAYAFDSEDRLAKVEPYATFADARFANDYDAPAEDLSTELPARLQSLLHARTLGDICIDEKLQRADVAEELLRLLDCDSDAAARYARDVIETSTDPLTRSLCSQVAEQIDAGLLGPESYLEVKTAFDDPFSFESDATRARAMARAGDIKAVNTMEDIVARERSLDAYKDTDTECYRAFTDHADRCLYELRCADDAKGRKVKPYPADLMYVHDNLAHMLMESAGASDESIVHALITIDEAPSSTLGYKTASRIYAAENDFENARYMCCKALSMTCSLEDYQLCLYWLAFAFLQTEHYEEAAACYRKAIQIGGPFTAYAEKEYGDLVEKVKGIRRRSFEENDELLRAAGVPIDQVEENIDFLFDCAVEFINHGHDEQGRVLLAHVSSIRRDDAFSMAVRSFCIQP